MALKFKNAYGICMMLFVVQIAFLQAQKETLTFLSSDQVKITADVYMTANEDAPFILLFHQAGYSRGEYLEIAPILNEMGYNCMAIDQRSGKGVNGVQNETYKDAVSKGKMTQYPDAYSDLEAALIFVKQQYHPKKIIVWGSSYSSSLVFILAAKHPEIAAIMSFSPGSYFEFEGSTIVEWAKQVKAPIFVTSSKNESKKCSQFILVSEHTKSQQYIPDLNGFHGSKALWKEKEGHEGYWKAVAYFLNEI